MLLYNRKCGGAGARLAVRILAAFSRPASVYHQNIPIYRIIGRLAVCIGSVCMRGGLSVRMASGVPYVLLCGYMASGALWGLWRLPGRGLPCMSSGRLCVAIRLASLL